MLAGKGGEEQLKAARKLKIAFPNQDNRGAHVNISGGGILKHSPNKDNAEKFLEFLLTKEAQEHIVNNSFEYPVIDTIALTLLLQVLATSKWIKLQYQILENTIQKRLN